MMIEVERLRVSLTKNGYGKIADLLIAFPSWEVVDKCDDNRLGIKLVRSQVAYILSEDPVTHEVPRFWEAIKARGPLAVESLTFLAVLFSHHRLVSLFSASSSGDMRGCIMRDDVAEKEFTNLVYAMSRLRLCRLERGADTVNYDLSPLRANLANDGYIVRKLLETKLARCGWQDPDRITYSTDGDFFAACRRAGFIAALGMTQAQFREWIETGTEETTVATAPRRPR